MYSYCCIASQNWGPLFLCFYLLSFTHSINSKPFLIQFRSQYTLMDARKEKNGGWLSVPQFGDWDQKGQVPDYSLDFSKIRETRKQNKTNISRASLGNDEEFNMDSTSSSANTVSSSDQQHTPRYHQTHSPSTRKSFLSYFHCCVKA